MADFMVGACDRCHRLVKFVPRVDLDLRSRCAISRFRSGIRGALIHEHARSCGLAAPAMNAHHSHL